MKQLDFGLAELKRIYTEAYDTDPIVRDGFDAMAEIFIKPTIKAIKSNDAAEIKKAEDNLKLLFGIVGETYNPEFPKVNALFRAWKKLIK